jgi:hypothetical protein
MITILSALVSLLSFRVRSRASLELELVALRHQVTVLRRQYWKRRLEFDPLDKGTVLLARRLAAAVGQNHRVLVIERPGRRLVHRTRSVQRRV